MSKIRYTLLSALIILVMCSVSQAANFYVDVARGNDSNSGTQSNPWKTITKANNTLKAGDTVYIRGGSYRGQQIAPSNSGTAANRITYRDYNNETPIITESDTPLLLSNRSYITVHGVKITNCDKYLTMINGHHNYLEYLMISNMRNYERFRGFSIGRNSSYNWIHHCTISDYGHNNGSDEGHAVEVGENPPGECNYNLIEDNNIYFGGHTALASTGKHNIFRNNYLHNEEWNNGYGNRTMLTKDHDTDGKDQGWNLYEGNRFAFAGLPIDNDHGSGIQHSSHDDIYRKNMFYACKGPGLKIETFKSGPYGSNNYVYHNVFFYNGIGGIATNRQRALWMRAGTGGPYPIEGTVIKNNIFYQNNGVNIAESGPVTGTVSANNWLTGNPFFKDAKIDLLNPSNPNYPNFNLQDNSPCVDTAAFLTKTIGSGSGTRIAVDDAHYFIDGWGIIEADIIQLEGKAQTARVIAVDYAKNILTIDKSLTWSANQGVSLQYNGLAPDRGAFETGLIEADSPLSAPENLIVVKYN